MALDSLSRGALQVHTAGTLHPRMASGHRDQTVASQIKHLSNARSVDVEFCIPPVSLCTSPLLCCRAL